MLLVCDIKAEKTFVYTADPKLGKVLLIITRLSQNQKEKKICVFAWMCFSKGWETESLIKKAFQTKAFFGNMQ